MANIPTGSATTNGATFLRIEADRVWRGSISVSSSMPAAIGLGAQSATPTVTVVSTTLSEPPNDAVVAGVSVTTPTVAALVGVGLASNNTVCQTGVVIKNLGVDPIFVKLNTTSNVQTLAVASGEITTS